MDPVSETLYIYLARFLRVLGDNFLWVLQVQQETLFELILAANYMDIKPLLDLTCATVASMIKVGWVDSLP